MRNTKLGGMPKLVDRLTRMRGIEVCDVHDGSDFWVRFSVHATAYGRNALAKVTSAVTEAALRDQNETHVQVWYDHGADAIDRLGFVIVGKPGTTPAALAERLRT